MSPAEAERAATLIEEQIPEVYANAVDPRHFYAILGDRFTTEMLKDALMSLVKDGGDVGNMLEDIEEWLEIARPYDDDRDTDDVYQPINWTR
jgi:hypothetical protein